MVTARSSRGAQDYRFDSNSNYLAGYRTGPLSKYLGKNFKLHISIRE